MGKSKELATVKDIVFDLLTKQEETRNSDMVLYVKVCAKVNKDALSKPFWHVMMHLKDYNLPNFETVRRARQKIQEDNPELAGNPDVEAHRIVNEQAFREFARG